MEQLQDVSKTTVLPQITPDIVRCVPEGTRQQANSKLWFRLRAGRITASRLHAVCHTNPSSPSRSLVLAVCYPESSKFETPATSWGIQKEKTARCEYLEILKRSHQGVSVVDTGLHLNQEWPFLGATPDGQVTCSCCGAGICEIKCPYTVRDQHLQHVAKTNFCLVKDENGILFLSKTHQYYYQVQAQLQVTGVDFCDFVVWTTKGIHVERIEPDSDFWIRTVAKAEKFFRNAVLPELLGKAFSRSAVQRRSSNVLDNPVQSTSRQIDKLCFCKTNRRTKTVTCANEACQRQFHIKCLNMKRMPVGDWVCADCDNKENNPTT